MVKFAWLAEAYENSADGQRERNSGPNDEGLIVEAELSG